MKRLLWLFISWEARSKRLSENLIVPHRRSQRHESFEAFSGPDAPFQGRQKHWGQYINTAGSRSVHYNWDENAHFQWLNNGARSSSSALTARFSRQV